MTTTDATEISREIKYSRATRDYDCYVNGQYVGSARNYSEGEALCDEIVYNMIADEACLTAAQLDGGSDPDACAVDVAALVIRGSEPEQLAAVLAHREAIICATCGDEGDCPDCDTLGETYECDGPDCIQVATHRISGFGNSHNNGSWCCYHYSELLGPCDCTDDDYGDALAESVQGTYNGAVPAPIDATALLEEADAVVGRLYCPHCLGNHLAQDCPLKRGDHAVAAYITRLAIDAGVLCSYCGERHADTACPQKRPLLAPRVCGNCGGQHSIQQCPEMREKLFAA